MDQQGGEAELVEATLRGDLAAFEMLVRRYQRRATAVAYRLLNNRDDAQEIVQDAFLKSFTKLATLSNPGRFGPWLMRIVANLSLNRRRGRALRQTASLDGSAGMDRPEGEIGLPDRRTVQPDQAAEAEDLRALIDYHTEQLPAMQRRALLLFSVAGMPQKEVAELLGCSVETVKWYVFTARKELKDKLKDYLHG